MYRWILLAPLMGCAPAASLPSAPPPPTLGLSVEAMELGTTASITVDSMAPGAPVRVYASPREVGAPFCASDLGGFCTDLSRPGVLLAEGTADASGVAVLDVDVPFTPLRRAWLQALSFDGGPQVSPVEPVDLFLCGDGDLSPAEACDDGNDIDGDLCSNTCEIAEPVVSDPGPVLKILFVGNSYTSRNNLASLVDQLATSTGQFTDVVTSTRTAGGRTIGQHAQEAASGGTLAGLLDPTDPANDWDVVVLQEQSQIAGFPESSPDYVNFMNGLAQLDGQIEALGAETALFLTWGRRDGDSLNPSLYPDFETMQARLSAGYYREAEALSRPDRRVHVLPTGEAFRAVYERDNADFLSLYSGDGSHPSFDGSYLAALVMLNRLVGTDLESLDVLRDGSGLPRAPEVLHTDAAMVGL